MIKYIIYLTKDDLIVKIDDEISNRKAEIKKIVKNNYNDGTVVSRKFDLEIEISLLLNFRKKIEKKRLEM